ncbi:hypothetical protein V8G54_023555 [Vigna mungo]|uniref:Aminotransferase-like plant mobile domain-containing protein n=1 Tax=Vigna mungo TaxID=3915 RepID=A0AAQ3RSC0_VIGMU
MAWGLVLRSETLKLYVDPRMIVMEEGGTRSMVSGVQDGMKRFPFLPLSLFHHIYTFPLLCSHFSIFVLTIVAPSFLSALDLVLNFLCSRSQTVLLHLVVVGCVCLRCKMDASTHHGSSTSKLTVQQSFSTNYISTLNNQLTQEHRSVIYGIPFHWFLDLSPKVRITRNILSELVVKWVDSGGSFLIGDKLVPMTENDFCLGLGLSTDGKDLNLKENFKRTSCVKYVGKDTKDLDLVYKCLMRKRKKKIPCSDFCSLYILVGISELLFPNRSRRVFPLLYEIVDSLSGLGNFCWGSLVWFEERKRHKQHLRRWLYLHAAVWFCENFMPPKIHKFPRILHWMNVHLRDNVVKRALESGVVHHDVDVDVMNDDKDEQPSPKMKDEKPPSTKKLLKRKLKESVMRTMKHQQNLVAELKREVLVFSLISQLNQKRATKNHNRSLISQLNQKRATKNLLAKPFCHLSSFIAKPLKAGFLGKWWVLADRRTETFRPERSCVENSERFCLFAVDVLELKWYCVWVPKILKKPTLLRKGMEKLWCVWRMRASMDASDIIEMNSKLKLTHQNRISKTPFKICLRIHDSIQLNLNLLKLLVRRWIPQHQSFFVRQQMGLGAGGVEVPSNDSIVGKVGLHISDCRNTSLTDLLQVFNVLVHNDDVDVDDLWAYERLGLYAHSSHRVFPRILRFHSLDYDIKQIDALLKKGEVHFDWYLSSEDRINPIIRATLNLDVGGRGEGSSPEGEAVEKEGDESSKGSTLAGLDTIRRNNLRIRTIRKELAAVRKELQDLRKLRNFGYVDKQGVEVADEDCAPAEVSGEAADQVFGEANEAAGDEAAGEASEAAAAKVAGIEGPTNEEAADEGPANEGPKLGADEAAHALGEEAAHEASDAHDEGEVDPDADGFASASGPIIDIGDDEDGGEVEPNVVLPLPTYNGDPRTTVNSDTLYNTVTRRDVEVR